MKPDQQFNYWQHDPATPDAPEEPQVEQTGPIVTLSPDQTVEPVVSVATDEPPHAPSSQEPVNWQAKEYIHHEKNAGWFVLFTLVVLVLLAVAILLMKSWTFAILVAVMAAAVVVYSRRPPRVLGYTLSAKGLYVGDKLYDFSEFKSFGVIRDGAEYSVMLIPTKRFMPGVTVYFPQEAGERIVDMLGARLPMEELHLDVVDKLVRKLRL
jgi:hypothetical protein